MSIFDQRLYCLVQSVFAGFWFSKFCTSQAPSKTPWPRSEVSAVSQLYPIQKVAAFVKLGLGLMGYNSADGEQELSARSLALQAGFGYDIPVKDRYVVVPHATLVQGFNNGLYLDGAKVTAASQMKLVRFGLAVGVRR